MRKPLSTVCFELARHAAEANHELLAYILRMAAGEALTQQVEAPPSSAERFVGVWDWDIGNDMNYVDPAGADIFGVDALAAAKGLPNAAYTRALHPDDFLSVTNALDAAIRDGGHFYQEYRVVQRNRVRWLSARGYVTLDASRRPIRFPGALFDITHQKTIRPPVSKAMALN